MVLETAYIEQIHIPQNIFLVAHVTATLTRWPWYINLT